MSAGKKILGILVWAGVFLLQLIMTQVVTFIVSLLLPGMGDLQQDKPVLFAVLLAVTFSAGIFPAGWLALKWGWLKARKRYPARLAGTLLGAAVPLALGLSLYRVLEAGSPAFLASILAAIMGFHLPGWFGGKQEA